LPWPCAFTPNTQNKAHLTVGFVASGGRRIGLSVAGGVVGRLRGVIYDVVTSLFYDDGVCRHYEHIRVHRPLFY
ncbi:MAG: hypothetical protein KBC57_13325, partial [Neisseriaceae bacterium]|nr:hypothetical protein [Neisseriaceae bacterium]